MRSGSEAGSYLRLTDSCTTQREAQGPSRTCNESEEEEEEEDQPVVHTPHEAAIGLLINPSFTGSQRSASLIVPYPSVDSGEEGFKQTNLVQILDATLKPTFKKSQCQPCVEELSLATTVQLTTWVPRS